MQVYAVFPSVLSAFPANKGSRHIRLRCAQLRPERGTPHSMTIAVLTKQAILQLTDLQSLNFQS